MTTLNTHLIRRLFVVVLVVCVVLAGTSHPTAAQVGLNPSAEAPGMDIQPQVISLWRMGIRVDRPNVPISRTINYAGYVDAPPSLRVMLQFAVPMLRFFFIPKDSAADPVLVISDAQGRYLWSDDNYGTHNPEYTFFDAPAGQYDVWVGEYNSQQSIEGYLYITTDEDYSLVRGKPWERFRPTAQAEGIREAQANDWVGSMKDANGRPVAVDVDPDDIRVYISSVSSWPQSLVHKTSSDQFGIPVVEFRVKVVEDTHIDLPIPGTRVSLSDGGGDVTYFPTGLTGVFGVYEAYWVCNPCAPAYGVTFTIVVGDYICNAHRIVDVNWTHPGRNQSIQEDLARVRPDDCLPRPMYE